MTVLKKTSDLKNTCSRNLFQKELGNNMYQCINYVTVLFAVMGLYNYDYLPGRYLSYISKKILSLNIFSRIYSYTIFSYAYIVKFVKTQLNNTQRIDDIM